MWPVTPIKNQGNCGSCWAFAAVAGMETAAIVQFGEAANLSEQQLVDCTTEKNDGCGGGWSQFAYEILQGKPMYTESSYPYTALDGTCQTGTDSGLRLSSYTQTFPEQGSDE